MAHSGARVAKLGGGGFEGEIDGRLGILLGDALLDERRFPSWPPWALAASRAAEMARGRGMQ